MLLLWKYFQPPHLLKLANCLSFSAQDLYIMLLDLLTGCYVSWVICLHSLMNLNRFVILMHCWIVLLLADCLLVQLGDMCLVTWTLFQLRLCSFLVNLRFVSDFRYFPVFCISARVQINVYIISLKWRQQTTTTILSFSWTWKFFIVITGFSNDGHKCPEIPTH